MQIHHTQWLIWVALDEERNFGLRTRRILRSPVAARMVLDAHNG